MVLWVFVVFAASITVFFGLMAIFGFWYYRTRRRESLVETRLAIGTASVETSEQQVTADEEKKGLAGALDSMLEDVGLHARMLALLEQAGEKSTPGSLALKVAASALLPAFFFGTLTMEPGVAMLSLVFGLIPLVLLSRKRIARMRKVDSQLPVALEIMMLSLRAGHSLAQTISLTAQELQSPIKDEFVRVADEHSLGRSMEEALLNMSRRLPRCKAMRTFVVAVLVLQQTGGNLIEVLERIIDTLRMQNQYERKLSAMTAEGRNSARMVGALPPAFIVLSYLADPSYTGMLFTDPMGQKLLIASLVLWLLGVFWTSKLVRPAS